jgi:hypothetical protein
MHSGLHRFFTAWHDRRMLRLESERDVYDYQHDRYVCTPTEVMSELDLPVGPERGRVYHDREMRRLDFQESTGYATIRTRTVSRVVSAMTLELATRLWSRHLDSISATLQGCLAHKKPPPFLGPF